AARRRQRRRRRTAVVAVLAAAAVAIGVDIARGPGTRVADRTLVGSAPPTALTPTAAPPTARYPARGPGTFGYAAGASPVQGRAGLLRRYRVAVESGTGQDAAAFAADVDRILGDPRGWSAGRRLRFQRVPGSGAADFTVLLATPVTSERLCAAGGLRTQRFTNCRVAGKVVINMARWWDAVPHYRAPLSTYRAYVINHEVGHELGYGHVGCPRRGAYAPVMQQQTISLRGCRAYGWPYLRHRYHTGPAVP
ncbi:MAG TPA: DUF3152 domain-containing protein, partial [Pilimelia sp.]|nr:DUF3152 domain-containing protein [Pilimelia sp.]